MLGLETDVCAVLWLGARRRSGGRRRLFSSLLCSPLSLAAPTFPPRPRPPPPLSTPPPPDTQIRLPIANDAPNWTPARAALLFSERERERERETEARGNDAAAGGARAARAATRAETEREHNANDNDPASRPLSLSRLVLVAGASGTNERTKAAPGGPPRGSRSSGWGPGRRSRAALFFFLAYVFSQSSVYLIFLGVGSKKATSVGGWGVGKCATARSKAAVGGEKRSGSAVQKKG